jgi:hypothetical protein
MARCRRRTDCRCVASASSHTRNVASQSARQLDAQKGLAQRGTLKLEAQHEDQKHKCRREKNAVVDQKNGGRGHFVLSWAASHPASVHSTGLSGHRRIGLRGNVIRNGSTVSAITPSSSGL